jgi:glutamine cyclotransferase
MELKVEKSNFKMQSSKLIFFVFGLVIGWGLLSLPFFVQKQVYGSGTDTPVFGYKIINIFPHDPEAFTQGLVFHRGALYEGTGLLGKSTLRKVDPATGRILKMVPLPDHYFGEGITLWEDKIIQLTWRSGIGLVYDRETFRLLKRFNFFTEGWGITQDGKQLIMSDGTSFLYFWDTHGYKEIKRIQVHDRGIPVTGLNELEYIKPSCPIRDVTPPAGRAVRLCRTMKRHPSDAVCRPKKEAWEYKPDMKIGSLSDRRYFQTEGEVFANVYPTDRIVRISPQTGQVTGWIDLRGLLPAKDQARPVDALNGIAYDARKDRILVTGKYWPNLFEIRLIPR